MLNSRVILLVVVALSQPELVVVDLLLFALDAFHRWDCCIPPGSDGVLIFDPVDLSSIHSRLSQHFALAFIGIVNFACLKVSTLAVTLRLGPS
jgi:hypothetical protein